MTGGHIGDTLKREARNEGSAIITSMLVSTVVVIVAVMAASLSVHNQQASGRDRNRTSAIHAAEAGFDLAMSKLRTTATVLLPCTMNGTLQTSPTARYSTKITYYADAAMTTSLLCNDPGVAVAPGAAVVASTGSVAGVTRTMEGAVRLGAVIGQLNHAIFSDQSPDLNNNLQVSGDGGEPVDVYTNGDWICPQSTVVHGSVLAQGLATMDNTCTVDEHLWVKGTLTMRNHSAVGANSISSREAIALAESSHVGNNAISAGTCTGCTSTRVGGSVSDDRGIGNVSDPPVSAFPQITGDTSRWAPVYSVESFATCGDARTYIGNGSGITAPTVVRITAPCELLFQNNSTVTLAADLAIITDGAITTEKKVVFRSSASSERRTLHVVVPYEVGPSCDTPEGNGNITTSNNTDLINIDYFVYSPCTVQFSNNNASSTGQVYGGVVVIENLFSLLYGGPIFVPGVSNEVVGYSTELAYLREVST